MADMSLGRYSVPDPYTLEEFRRVYQSADATGRIRLLQRLLTESELAFGAATDFWRHAIEDEHVEVRQWMARFGPLHVVECLKSDPDAFVRACVRENEGSWLSLLSLLFGLEREFGEATHLERLALLRNPRAYHIPMDFLKRLFDFDDPTLGIDAESRKQLIRAFLTNRRALTSKDQAGDPNHSSLWTIISRGPADVHDLKAYVYRFVKADTRTKAETYRACTDKELRGYILEGSGAWDRAVALAMGDPDDSCYLVAREKRKERWRRWLPFHRVDIPNDHPSVMDVESTEQVMKAIETRIRKEVEHYASRTLVVVYVVGLGFLIWRAIFTEWTWIMTPSVVRVAAPVSVIACLAWLGRRWWAYRSYVSLGGTRGFFSHLAWRFDRASSYSSVETDTAVFKRTEA